MYSDALFRMPTLHLAEAHYPEEPSRQIWNGHDLNSFDLPDCLLCP